MYVPFMTTFIDGTTTKSCSSASASPSVAGFFTDFLAASTHQHDTQQTNEQQQITAFKASTR